ncbi:MAG: 3-dehydroquinate synthase [Granulosicoccaceae bacterium]
MTDNEAASDTTSTTVQEFTIPYSYPVSFTYDLFNPSNPLLNDTLCLAGNNRRHRLLVFIDEGVVHGQADLLSRIDRYVEQYEQSMDLVTHAVAMPAGEQLKSELHFIEQMQKVICEQHIDRHSFVIGIGGGALLDAVGLVAATSHRGIRHIRIPTTVLAQNDSGVGVKNGVNLLGQKNYIGTFAPPFAVLNDYRFIETLPDRDKISGMAEAVKVALIRDAVFYKWIENNREKLTNFDPNAMRHMIKRCAELHMHQIANGGDPFETGSVRPLDFGHWAAHRLETITRYRLRHGEAVAIGIALDTHYSVLAGLLSAGADERVHSLLSTLGFTLWHAGLELKNSEQQFEILQGLRDFQEHLGGELTITLLRDVGVGKEVHEMDHALVLQAVQWLKQRHDSQDQIAAHR